jgi:hypothetical protein
MNRVVLDAELRAKLNGGQTGAEIVDEAGNVVGHYVPHDRYVTLLNALIPPLTPEERSEAIREMREGRGATTAEILEAIAEARRAWEARQ